MARSSTLLLAAVACALLGTALAQVRGCTSQPPCAACAWGTGPFSAAPHASPSPHLRLRSTPFPPLSLGQDNSCSSQGLQGSCNACVCCCYASEAGFVNYEPTDDCTCKRYVNSSQVSTTVVIR